MKTPPAFVRVLFSGLLLLACSASALQAELRLPAIFTDNMVLQREIPVRVWGWDKPGQLVRVAFAGQNVAGKAGSDGRWEVTLEPLETSRHVQTLVVTGSGNQQKHITNVLVGEVWICSGQSNMQWSVSQSYDADLEIAAADYPSIRLISVPQVGTQELQDDFNGRWEPCTPETVAGFSAVGFYFGRQLYQQLGVPIGLIDNAWGGSAAEAWIRRDVIEKDERFADLIEGWKKTESTYDFEMMMKVFQEKRAKWEEDKKAGKKVGNPPRAPRNQLAGNHRPGNIFAGVLNPTIGYGIRGAIWYQGESNSARAWQYRELFPFMISHWREQWGQGDFPFYWVQLADFRAEVPDPGDSTWAELREAQTQTMDQLPNTGEAVIYDVGEGRDIHPRDKLTVGRRLARWALENEYGKPFLHRSARYESMEVKGNKVLLTFKDVGSGGLYVMDHNELKGFAVAGEDQEFVWAKARVVGKNQVEVTADGVAAPVAVRYAWADNPVANLYSDRMGLPVTPFRTDEFPAVTDPASSSEP